VTLPDPTALVIIDVQNAIDDPTHWGPGRNNPLLEQNLLALLSAWRKRGWPVYHVQHLSVEWDSPYRPGQIGCEFKLEVEPRAGEELIQKTTNSAFIGTDLEARLRERCHHTLVVTGVITNNSVEATVRMAGNLGFDVFVPADAAATFEKKDVRGQIWSADDVHSLSLANMHGEYATVTDVTAVLAGINAIDT